jgi:hypothetical protein
MSQTVLQVLTDAYIAYRGKSSNIPQPGTDKYNDMLAILNRKQREWWSDPNTDWPSLFQLETVGTLVAGTQIYACDDDFLRPSDYVIVQDSNGNNKYITVVKPAQRTQYTLGCYFSGTQPLQVTFITTIDENYAGLTLITPGYIKPDDMVNTTDIVPVDDPNWLVYSVAAELARNDYSKEEQFPNLNGIANNIYQQMVDAAFANGQLQPDGVPNNMPQYNGLQGNVGFSAPFGGF